LNGNARTRTGAGISASRVIAKPKKQLGSSKAIGLDFRRSGLAMKNRASNFVVGWIIVVLIFAVTGLPLLKLYVR
jgi:hypothetical protein